MMLVVLLSFVAAQVKFAEPVILDDVEPVVGTIEETGFEMKGRGFPRENSNFKRDLELKGIDPKRCKCYPCSVPTEDVEKARNSADRFDVERALLEQKIAKQKKKIATLTAMLN